MSFSKQNAAALAVADMEVPGIRDTLRGKHVMLTGGTGFMGVAAIFKLLNDVDFAKLYVLVRHQKARPARGRHAARPFVSAEERLRKQMATDRAYEGLRARYGAKYESWWQARMVAVAGDVCEDRLGIDDASYRMLAENLDLVMHSVASVQFTLPFDEAFTINVHGAVKVQELLHATAKYSKRHPGRPGALVHISTCYTATRFLPQSLVYENCHHLNFDGVECYYRQLEGKISEAEKEKMMDSWLNSYFMTKAWTEVLITHLCQRDNIPLCVFRPAAIGAAYAEPSPGWINQLMAWAPVALNVGAGRLTEVPGAPSTEIVAPPIDYCTNHMLACVPFILNDAAFAMRPTPAFATHSSTTGGPGRIMTTELWRLSEEFFRANPLPFQAKKPGDEFCNVHANLVEFWEAFNKRYDHTPNRGGGLRRMMEQVGVALMHGWQFDRTIQKKVLASVKGDERQVFPFDYDAINPQHYFPIALEGLARFSFGDDWREKGQERMQTLWHEAQEGVSARL